MTMLGKAAVLASAALGLPFLTGEIEAGKPDEIVPVSERVQTGFCKLIAEAGPNEVGKCDWASRGWGVEPTR